MNWNKIRKAKWFIPLTAVVLVLALTVGVLAVTTPIFNSCTVNTTGSIAITSLTPTALVVTPNPGASLQVGATEQFIATITWNNGTNTVVTTDSHTIWSINGSSSIATVGTSTGIVTGVGIGACTVQAVYTPTTGTPQTATSALTVINTFSWSIGGTTVVGPSTTITVNFTSTQPVYAGVPFTAIGVASPVAGLQVVDIGANSINNWTVGTINDIPTGLTNVSITATSPSITTGNSAMITLTLTATGTTSGTTISLSGMNFTLTPGS